MLTSKTCYSGHKFNRIECPPVSENLECEIAIIGGGLAGLSLAYQLAKHGEKFILIESERIGDCASGINGGFCSPGWAVDHATLVSQYGRKVANDFYNLSLEGLRWVHSFKDENDFRSVDFNIGTMNLSLLKSESSAYQAYVKNDLIIQNERDLTELLKK